MYSPPQGALASTAYLQLGFRSRAEQREKNRHSNSCCPCFPLAAGKEGTAISTLSGKHCLIFKHWSFNWSKDRYSRVSKLQSGMCQIIKVHQVTVLELEQGLTLWRASLHALTMTWDRRQRQMVSSLLTVSLPAGRRCPQEECWTESSS